MSRPVPTRLCGPGVPSFIVSIQTSSWHGNGGVQETDSTLCTGIVTAHRKGEKKSETLRQPVLCKPGSAADAYRTGVSPPRGPRSRPHRLHLTEAA